MQGVGVSIARGTGRQTFGAAIIFVSYYVFALPIGAPLMFATSLGLAGMIHKILLLTLHHIHRQSNTNFLDCILTGFFIGKNVVNFTGGNMADT